MDPGCTLPPAALGERLDWIRREILPHVLATEPCRDGLALELGAAPGLAGTLDRWIALERDCCTGLVIERRPGAAAGRLRLEIRGVDADTVLRWISADEARC